MVLDEPQQRPERVGRHRVLAEPLKGVQRVDEQISRFDAEIERLSIAILEHDNKTGRGALQQAARIAEIFECSEVTVRTWIKRFEANGMAGLHDHPRPGRPERGGRRHDLPRE